MKFRVLGCSGGIGGQEMRTSAFLVDDDVLIDGGTGVGALEYDALLRIDHIFVTHAHLDHIGFIPLLVDTVGNDRRSPITVYGTVETIRILRSHIFNWLVWPDFSAIPDRHRPFMRFQVLKVGETIALDGRKITALPALHTVPAAAYCLDSGDGQLIYTGDTTYCPALISAINRQPALRHLVIETAFSDAQHGLAVASRHLCPSLLARFLDALTCRPEVHISHLKPGHGERTMAEIGVSGGAFRPSMLRNEQVLTF
ncbi:MAG TPA: 3',5'-cyclic-nucleotide phosphodiesterase [Denitromonas sp.]|uniref:3',5'-cyclic-nucleotide phosphodiesterase n=1 Tax=Denitromonas sp. TaxID=2734609 RepID=UPI001DDBB1F6|nr:3',5'-cyclic-nucleotide phosphodiesterase [Rhodocyclaceae bacterium]HQU87473.1 3',5'-cyclic-nucleotide phosphodiesterase [Denitromonas sp.]HQV13828.1 3',5'-cyclic-nucleotide phosphodiesterase [Denitromonas sp.]